MGFRFQRRIRILPGLRLNLSKGGASASVGGRGAWYTFGRGRRRITVGVPGTGVSYTTATPTSNAVAGEPNGTQRRGWIWWCVIAVLGMVLWRWFAT